MTKIMSGFAPRPRAFTRADVLRGALCLAAASVSRAALAAGESPGIQDFVDGQGMPYDAFDRLPVTDLPVRGGVIHVGFAPGRFALPKARYLARIREAARAVTTYYGRFPVASVRFLLAPVDGEGIRGGTTWGYRGGAVRILFGQGTTEGELHRDWVMTHEMVHLALPDLSRRYNWLSEGLAVYIEPIARVQAGDLTAIQIWSDMKRDMPQGLPRAGDRGLDNTPTWGRTYWGGALFCLMTDIGIRQKSNNRLGLQDAMRGVLAAGGNHETDWPIGRILSTADAATGFSVMSDLYNDMRAKPVSPDLDKVWRDLGVNGEPGGVSFDDAAPLAAVRIALTKPPASE
jgi:hypothetical protein